MKSSDCFNSATGKYRVDFNQQCLVEIIPIDEPKNSGEENEQYRPDDQHSL